jgi:hypothetical protein
MAIIKPLEKTNERAITINMSEKDYILIKKYGHGSPTKGLRALINCVRDDLTKATEHEVLDKDHVETRGRPRKNNNSSVDLAIEKAKYKFNK